MRLSPRRRILSSSLVQRKWKSHYLRLIPSQCTQTMKGYHGQQGFTSTVESCMDFDSLSIISGKENDSRPPMLRDNGFP